MSMNSNSREILWPTDTNILVRAVFLYVGQGSSTIILAANAETYISLLLDINLDAKNGGVDVPELVADLVGEEGLDVFVNTHPHDDHLRGVTELSEKVSIGEVWHSDHIPGKNHDDAYQDLKRLIGKVKGQGGSVELLKGSKSEQKIGDARYYVLAPAAYVTDSISDERSDVRYQRIHEQCAVLKFGIGDAWIMTPGDADRDAFEKRITGYHADRLRAVVLAAPHHGSRDFFRHEQADEPYLDALKAIDPDYVVVSAPKRGESKHDHPHPDAMSLYAEKVGKDGVLHTGEKRYCYICDIFRDGTYSGIEDDKGKLAETYSLDGDDGDDGKTGGKGEAAIGVGYKPRTRVDDTPMGG